MVPPGFGLEQALAPAPDAPGEGMPLHPTGGFHPPMGPGALRRVAQHEDQPHGRVIGGDARQGVWPIDIDRRRLPQDRRAFRGEMGVIGAVVRRGPVLRVVVEEVRLLDVGESDRRVVGEVIIERGRARLLHADHDEIHPRLAGHMLRTPHLPSVRRIGCAFSPGYGFIAQQTRDKRGV